MADYTVLTVDQGTDTVFRLEIVDSNKAPVDLAGCTVTAKFKKSFKSADAFAFECSIDSPTASGLVNLELAGTTTNAMKPGNYLYDVEITKGYTTERILEGPLEITPGVTKSDIF